MSRGIKKIVLQGLASAAVFALNVPLTLAQGVPVESGIINKGIPDGFISVASTINLIFKIVISAAGAIFVLMFLFGGIQYLTSAGNEEGSTKARKLLVDSIVGLIIVLAAYALGSWILAQVGLTSDPNLGTF